MLKFVSMRKHSDGRLVHPVSALQIPARPGSPANARCTMQHDTFAFSYESAQALTQEELMAMVSGPGSIESYEWLMLLT